MGFVWVISYWGKHTVNLQWPVPLSPLSDRQLRCQTGKRSFIAIRLTVAAVKATCDGLLSHLLVLGESTQAISVGKLSQWFAAALDHACLEISLVQAGSSARKRVVGS